MVLALDYLDDCMSTTKVHCAQKVAQQIFLFQFGLQNTLKKLKKYESGDSKAYF